MASETTNSSTRTLPLDEPQPRDWVPVPSPSSSSEVSDPSIADSFTLLTQNVLADRYTESDLYPWVPQPEVYLDKTFRSRRLAQQILHLEGDVVCLQELQFDQLQFMMHESEDPIKLDGIYEAKYKQISNFRLFQLLSHRQISNSHPSASPSKEGVGILWKRDKFDLLDCVEIEFNPMAAEEAFDVFSDATVMHADVKRELFLRRVCLASHNVALIVVLQSKENPEKRILVATIHGFWRKTWWAEQCYQYEILMRRIEEVSTKHGIEEIIVCGDFNMKRRTSPALRFVENGNIDADFDEMESEELGEESRFRQQSIWKTLNRRPTHDLRLCQAYPVDLKPFSHFSKRELVFDCLDYVFHVPGKLFPLQVLKVGGVHVRCPNKVQYSDHCMLGVKFGFE